MSVEIVPAVGRFAEFAAVVGPAKEGAPACWCMSLRDGRLNTEQRRQHMVEECATEPGPGILALVDGEPAGWCSVAPRSTHRRLMVSRTIPFVDDRDPWSVVCFVIRPPFRRQGLMHTLLAGAVDHARRHGAEVVEGYPAESRPERMDQTFAFVGTTALFEDAGFERVLPTTAHSDKRVRWLMRRELR